MNRRGFLAALAAVPALPMAAKADGVVREQEFVMRANASKRWLHQLEAMNSSHLKPGKLPNGAVVGSVVNPERQLVSFSDEPCRSIEMYDGHAALTFDRDYATEEELLASSGKPGRYATCLARGLARPFGSFNGRPAYEWGAIIR